jgi:hypothetical protein
MEVSDELAFIAELRRVAGNDFAGTNFFSWPETPSDESLRQATARLRTFPSELGIAELERRLAADVRRQP